MTNTSKKVNLIVVTLWFNRFFESRYTTRTSRSQNISCAPSTTQNSLAPRHFIPSNHPPNMEIKKRKHPLHYCCLQSLHHPPRLLSFQHLPSNICFSTTRVDQCQCRNLVQVQTVCQVGLVFIPELATNQLSSSFDVPFENRAHININHLQP
jgi:hypothetical protein